MIALIMLIDVVLALGGLLLMWLCTRPGQRRAAIRAAIRADRNPQLFAARCHAPAVTRSPLPGPFVVAG